MTSLTPSWSWIDEVRCELLDNLRHHEVDILRTMMSLETAATARDEFARSVRTLEGIDRERSDLTRVSANRLASFLPLNQPLYALVLFGIVPALAVDSVLARPATLTTSVVEQIFELVIPARLRERLALSSLPRREFVQRYAGTSDVVVLTGTSRTASTVLKSVGRRTTFVFNGSGVTPAVVLRGADIEPTARDIVGSVTYNSGQDCAAPQCVLVERSVADEAVASMTTHLAKLRCGSLSDPSVQVGPVLRRTSIESSTDFLWSRSAQIVHGGSIDLATRVVEPTMVVSRLSDSFEYPELYAPVVNLAVFDDGDELVSFFHSDRYQRNAMYASVYGRFDGELPRTEILRETSVLHHEDGNKPFGGRGTHASFVKLPGKRPVRGPVLLSAALVAE